MWHGKFRLTQAPGQEYAARDETRREYALELQGIFGYRPFTIVEYRRLYTAENAKSYPMLLPFIGNTINLKQLLAQWSEILRLACSIRLGTLTSSLILRKLASYPRQNGLALALREFGRIERTLFILDWLLDKDLRQRVTAGLNKGELPPRPLEHHLPRPCRCRASRPRPNAA